MNRILLSGVGEPFLDQNIRYCPIYCVYNFDKIITSSFTVPDIFIYITVVIIKHSREFDLAVK